MGSQVKSVRFTGKEIARGTKPYEPMPEVTKLETGDAGALVSRLERDDRVFLVLVNRDIRNTLPLALQFAKGVDAGFVNKDGAVSSIRNGDFQGAVNPGDAAIFMWMKR